MVEELYIYDKNGTRRRVDLNTPSGITLKWVSNMFNSLDKVNCSYSYTFKIPMTRHNREVFDFAEDIRHTSGLLGKKLKAEFIQNGIPLFRNGNLYIDKSTADSYSCVFTWDVIEGLQKLKDESCSLNELRDALIKAGYESDELAEDGIVRGMTYYYSPSTFSNNSKTLSPYYSAGVPFAVLANQERKFFGEFDKCYPRPVMPVRYLLQTIEKAFGLKIDLGKAKAGEKDLKVLDDEEKVYEKENIISYGCIPFISSNMTDKQLGKFTMNLEPNYIDDIKSFLWKHKILGQENVFLFKNGDVKFDAPQGDTAYIFNLYVDISAATVIDSTAIGYKRGTNLYQVGFATPFEAKVELKFRVKSKEHRYDTWSDNDDDKIQLVIFSREKKDSNSSYEYDEVTKIKPTLIETKYKNGGEWDYDILTFDTYEEDGYSPLSIGEEQVVSELPKIYLFKMSMSGCESLDFDGIKVTPKLNDAKYISHYIDTFTNLPDIDCFAFVKSLFYLVGEYPRVYQDGVIKGFSYKEFYDNIKNGYIYDWSRYIINRTTIEEVSYDVGDFKQNNFYMTKWDDIDRTSEELKDENDVYEDGILNVKIDRNCLDKEQTVFQLPFYPPYILNRKCPSVPTGNSVKAWDFELSSLDEPASKIGDQYVFHTVNKHLRMCESQPAYGILHCRPFYDSDGNEMKDNNGDTIRFLKMDILNPFVDTGDSSSYTYLQNIVKNPYVITESLRLGEYELMNLDFARPVYLDKYSGYFAISSIQRDSKGICKCELIKLPTK